MVKDLFSKGSDQYAKYRPQYPRELFEWIYQLPVGKGRVWDVGAGTGQLSFPLSEIFGEVYATDISESQLFQAPKKSNIHYSVQAAELTDFAEDFFDLVVIGQAIHWFDFERFYREVRRVSKKNAIIIAVGYGNVIVSEDLQPLISEFYGQKLGAYWDSERRYIDEEYSTIPFPFEEMIAPTLSINYQWKLNQLIGYFNTWSAVKHFIQSNGYNPVVELYEQLSSVVKDEEVLDVRFKIIMKTGRVG